MNGYDFSTIPDTAWDAAEAYFHEHSDEIKFSKKEHPKDTPVSFIKVNDRILAIGSKLNEKSSGGSIKAVYDRTENQIYIVKIENAKDSYEKRGREHERDILDQLDELIGSGNRVYMKKSQGRDKHYLVIERYDSDLTDYLQKHFVSADKMPKQQFVELMFYIIESLINLKDRGLFHDDFSLNNIFVDFTEHGRITRLNMGDHGSTNVSTRDERKYLDDIYTVMRNAGYSLNNYTDLKCCFTDSSSFEEIRSKILQLKDAKQLNLDEVKTTLSPSLLLFRAQKLFTKDGKLSSLLEELTSIKNDINKDSKQKLDAMKEKIFEYRDNPQLSLQVKVINKLVALCHIQAPANREALFVVLDSYKTDIKARVNKAKTDTKHEYKHRFFPFKETFQVKVTDKDVAVDSFIQSLEQNTEIKPQHMRALTQGTLKTRLNEFLSQHDTTKLCGQDVSDITEFISAYNEHVSKQHRLKHGMK